jgi:REP element-mobilizing transposase RayT
MDTMRQRTRYNRRSIRLQGYDYATKGAYFVTICTQGRAFLFGEVVEGEMRLNEVGRIVEDVLHAIPDHFPHVALDEYVVMPDHLHVILLFDCPAIPVAVVPVGATHAVAGATHAVVGATHAVVGATHAVVGATHASPLPFHGRSVKGGDDATDVDDAINAGDGTNVGDVVDVGATQAVAGATHAVAGATHAVVGATHASPLPSRGPWVTGVNGMVNVGSRTSPPPDRPCGPPRRSVGAVVGAVKSAASKRINEHRGTPAACVWQRNYYEHILRDHDALNRIRRYIRDNPSNFQDPAVQNAEPGHLGASDHRGCKEPHGWSVPRTGREDLSWCPWPHVTSS